MDLSSNIKELLYKNDCVIIPNIGGFVTQSSPASVDMIEQVVVPPSKSVSFNIKLNHNVGLIANHVAAQANIPFNEAKIAVEQYCQNIEDDLFNNKIVHFKQLGKLFFNADGKLEFVPEKCNFLIDAYGLPDLDCIPILRNKKYLKEVLSPEAVTVSTVKPNAKIPYTKLAAACLLIVVFVSFIYSNDWLIGPSNNLADTISETPDSSTQIATATVLPLPNTNFIDTAETIEATPDVQDTTYDDAITAPTNDKKPQLEALEAEKELEDFIIVLGAFGKKKNADRLSKKLAADNYLPDVTFKNGLNRVGVQISCTNEELQQHLQFLRDNYNPKAWIVE